tara:strand:- start:105 stop:341 length:237 start_codon:yes stop_codon:yes gene_type:complete
MSPEVSLLHEVWDSIRSHIAIKERLHEAERLLKLFEDHIDMDDLEINAHEFDKFMKAAIVSYYDEWDDDDDDDDYSDY